MADILTKLNLKTEFEEEFNSDSSGFTKLLKEKTESSDLDFLTEFVNALSFAKKDSSKPLKGIITHDSFTLKENVSLNSLKSSTAIAKGNFSLKNGLLAVNVKIIGINYKMIPVCIFSFFIFIDAIASLNIGNSERAYIVTSIVLFGISLLPYLKMRWDTVRLAKSIVKEFDFIKTALQQKE